MLIDVPIQVALEPLDSPKLRQIGEVTADGRLTPIVGTIPSATITRSDLDRLGEDPIVDALQTLPGATFTRPDGGAASAIAVVSLRGPDPSESLIALDGHLLNDDNTGDVDLSRFPASAFSAIDVTEGLGPEDSNGSNTFGGAIDLVSLRPTRDSHYALSLSGGSFGQSEAWFNATGTQGRLGYATAFDDQNETGYANTTAPLYSTTDPTCAPCATRLGSAVAAHLALGSLTWSFAQNADLTARVFALGDNRDQSSAINGIDNNVADLGSPQYGELIGPGNQSFAQVIRAYQLRGRAPLGAGELTSEVSVSDNSVDVSRGTASPYDVVHQDHRYNGALTWQRAFASSQLAVGGYTRYESLDVLAPPSSNDTLLSAAQAQPILGQTIDVLFVRGGFTPTAKLRLDGGVLSSRYTTFGSNVDGRFGAIYTADPRTAVRFSLGTGFRAPLLLERYQFPYAQLSLDGNNVFVGQGSPSEHPEHATEYELGASHEFSRQSTLDLSLYRTSLRDPVEIFYPLAAVAAGTCKANSYANPIPACVSFNSNVGNAVYSGMEVRFVQRFVPQHLFLTARYGLNSAYPKDLNAQFSNPTSGGNLVDNAQFLGIPQQQGSLELDWADRGWHSAANAVFRGNNNELNLAPFTVVNALAGKHFGGGLDLSLAATNIFNGGAGRYTVFGGGVPYRGIIGQSYQGTAEYGPLPTDAKRCAGKFEEKLGEPCLFFHPAMIRSGSVMRHFLRLVTATRRIGIKSDRTCSRKLALVANAIAFLSLPAAFALLVLCPLPVRASEAVVCTDTSPLVTHCRISEPNVQQRRSPYPQVTFRPGDIVVVSAGGCVQTGGGGRTWKRYVNPQGPNSDHLYHGSINIPGAMPAGWLMRLAGAVDRNWTIPSTLAPGTRFLVLGYEDDGYGDNGYYAPDDGNPVQCRNVGPAWVEITMQHSATAVESPSGSSIQSAPFDLVWDSIDPNGIALNPKWAWETTHPDHPNPDTLCAGFPYADRSRVDFGTPPCTTQAPTADPPTGFNSLICRKGVPKNFDGHVNWMPATIYGHIFWNDHKSWDQGGDDDYNVRLQPGHRGALTSNNPEDMLVEFDSSETVDQPAFRTDWWNQFHSAVDRGGGDTGDGPAGAMIDGKEAIIVGLLGIDTEHGAHSELHPAWGFAVHVSDSPYDDQWAFFARSSGNEGFCSQDQHHLDLSKLSFFLPRANTSDVSVTAYDVNFEGPGGGAPSPTRTHPQGLSDLHVPLVGVTVVPTQGGAIVTFGDINLTARSGLLHLAWTASKVSAPAPPSPFGVLQAPPQAYRVPARGPEDVGADLIRHGPGLQKTFSARRPPGAGSSTPSHLVDARTQPSLFAPQFLTSPVVLPAPADTPPATRAVHDVQKAEKEQLRAVMVCRAYHGHIPSLPNACLPH
jgi:outer membrane receptor protein involved in Fe transport